MAPNQRGKMANQGISKPPVQAQWTASRCNRTLRQLTSFVTRIERWHRDFNTKQNNAFQPKTNTSKKEKDDIGLAVPGWLQEEKSEASKRRVRNYKTRKTGLIPRTPHRPTEPGSVLLDTPMFASSPQQIPDEMEKDVSDRCTAPNMTRSQMLSDSLFADKLDGRAPTFFDADFVITSFLNATSDPQLAFDQIKKSSPSGKGSKSLLLLCSTQLGSDMVDEQGESDAVADGHNGHICMAFNFLQDLEDHFGDSKKGWALLRPITRAYGIKMICDSIISGILSSDIAASLADAYFRQPFLCDAAEAVTRALIHAEQVQRTANDGTDPVRYGLSDVLKLVVAIPNLRLLKNPDSNAYWLSALDMVFGELNNAMVMSWTDALHHDWVSRLPEVLRFSVFQSYHGVRENSLRLLRNLFLNFLGMRWDARKLVIDQLRRVQTVEAAQGARWVNAVTPKGDPALQSTDNIKCCEELDSIFYSALASLVVKHMFMIRGTSSGFYQQRTPTEEILHNLSKSIEQHIEVVGLETLSTPHLIRASSVLFVHHIAHMTGRGSTSALSYLSVLQQVLLKMKSYHLAPTSFSVILDLVIHGTTKKPGVHLLTIQKNISAAMLNFDWKTYPDAATMLADFNAHYAMAYASVAQRAEEITWANQAQEVAMVVASDHSVGVSGPASTSFLWDDWLGEWVAKPPVITPEVDEHGSSRKAINAVIAEQDGAVPQNQTATTTEPSKQISPNTLPRDCASQYLKRKSTSSSFELDRDGDFEYKKRRKISTTSSVKPLRNHSRNMISSGDNRSQIHEVDNAIIEYNGGIQVTKLELSNSGFGEESDDELTTLTA